MPLDLASLRRLAQAATPGPWRVGDGSFASENLIADVRGVSVWGPYHATSCGEEAAYIASVSPDVLLALLAEVERLRAALKNYGSHEEDCTCGLERFQHKCSCGLDAALTGGI